MKQIISLSIVSISCYYSCACGQIFFCFKRHANEANGSTQSKIDPFASFACQTADNCNNSYCEAKSIITCDHTLPPLYWDAVKEGMIHLLVGSYVKKPDSGVFSDWSRNNAYETLHSYWLSYFNLISGQNVGLARRKQNGGDRARF